MANQKKRVGLYIPEKLHGKIKTMAKKRGMTLNSFCLDVLWQRVHVEKKKTEKSNDAESRHFKKEPLEQGGQYD